ncbi:MAG: PAS domain S-box protein [Acidobacteria bacterium]|nr:PAS domain S-box protein [Acidobacteriota bacterium]
MPKPDQASTAEAPRARLGPLTIASILTAVIFALDVEIRPGTGMGALYVIPVLLVSYAGPPHLAFWGAWIASLLLTSRLLPYPLADLSPAVLINRITAFVVVWTTASIVFRLRETATQRTAIARDLADLKSAIDQSAIVATTNTKGTITFVNDKFCEISKYTREELLGQDHRILNSGFHPKEFMRDLWVTIASGRIWRGEIRNRAKDGSLYWVDTTIVPFLDPAGKPYQYMAIRYEITDRKRSEDLLREQAALARLGEMAAVVAHEVKNPIAGIRGALQVIGSRMTGDPRDRAVVGDIITRLDALNGIVQDLLVYARPRQLKREPVDLKSLITSLVSFLRRDPAFARLQVEVRGEPPPVSADPEQLRLVLQNIVMNAAQAMGGDGTVEITLSCEPGTCRISVRDHGPGMTPEVMAKAFDAFFTTKHRGTGLGLPIARRVVEAHGGHIVLMPVAGGGTVASIEFGTPPAQPRA